jgi:hypothetical protein
MDGLTTLALLCLDRRWIYVCKRTPQESQGAYSIDYATTLDFEGNSLRHEKIHDERVGRDGVQNCLGQR